MPENASGEIVIQATVVNPPPELLRFETFLSYTRGVDSSTGTIVDEPDSEEPALTIELRVDEFLEPIWQVVADRQANPAPIRASQRAKFGVTRLSSDGSTDLRWSRSSTLLRMTDDDDHKPTTRRLLQAARVAKAALGSSFSELSSVTDRVAVEARALRGVRSDSVLSATLNSDSLQVKEGAVSLHQDDVPMERHGLGSRRLTGIAVQLSNATDAGILLIDEIEAGLEPHRIRHLLRNVKNKIQSPSALSQVFLTTHSPVVLRELYYNELAVVRTESSAKTIIRIPEIEMQGVLRKNAEAFLAPSVLVCEGITEEGFARAVFDHQEHEDPNLIAAVATADAGGEGTLVPYANAFSKLGYRTGVFFDNDTKKDFSGYSSEVTQIRCDAGLSLEKQIAYSLDAEGIRLALEHGIENLGPESVFASFEAHGCPNSVVVALRSSIPVEESELTLAREALGRTALRADTARHWFKSMNGGERLAEIILKRSSGTPSARLISSLARWGFDG